MAHFIFKLPDIGEGIAQAEIVAWHVQPGDVVSEGQPLADMMTDKATVEMECPVGGTVVELAGAAGEMVAIGAMLAVIETQAAQSEPAVEPARAPSSPGDAAMAPPEGGRAHDEPAPVAPARALPSPDEQATGDAAMAQPEGGPAREEPAPVAAGEGAARQRPVLASPAVRARARALGIDLADIRSASDHVRHADLDAYLVYHGGQGFRPAGGKRADETIRVIGLRRRIAENMAASKRQIPHFTYVEEIDVTALEAMRTDLNGSRGERPRLTMLPLLIVGICKALADFPMMNARYDDEAGIVTRCGSVHLGIAVQTDGGLMVPVLRDAQDRNLWQLASEIARLAEAARSGKATLEELSGSTLTLSSLGPLGGVATTPVINRPEVAIIAPNRVIDRPVIRNGEIVPAKLMNLSVSCDHRVVDGWDAARFVQALRKLLETPVLLFAP